MGDTKSRECIDVGWVEQRGTQEVQALRWVTLRCTQPKILGLSIHCDWTIVTAQKFHGHCDR